MGWIQSKPVRTIMRWQLIVTVVMVLILAPLWGLHGALSAFLGGVVSIAAAAAFAAIVSRYHGSSISGALKTALRAEAVKIMTMVALLWLVLTFYKDVVAVGFIGTFAITVLVFGMALFVPDDTRVVPQIK